MITNIVFSKNRAFQLGEFLRTSTKFYKGKRDIVVLYTCDEQFNKSYDKLIDDWPNVKFVKQVNFCDDLKSIINSSHQYILFATDDLFVFREFDLDAAVEALENIPNLWGVQPRLHPGLFYCAPANAQETPAPTLSETPFFKVFDVAQGVYDWGWPFDVSSGLYKKSEVEIIIDFPMELTNPNYFESSGHTYFTSAHYWSRKQFHIAYPHNPCCCLITTNRVQDTHPNNFTPVENGSVEDLDKLFWANRELNESWYSNQTFNRICVGDFVLKGIN